MSIYFISYLVELETKEKITVAEIIPELFPEFFCNSEVLLAAADVLDRCSRMPRHVLESAKMGHSREFEALVRTPPVGCLLKLKLPVCAEIKSCAIANPVKCTTRFVEPRRRGAIGRFPPCWEMETDPKLSQDVNMKVRSLASGIVSSWKSGHYVIIVED